MPRPIKGSQSPTTSKKHVSAAVLASSPLLTFPRWIIEGLVIGLLKQTRKLQGNEVLRKETVRRVMFFLDRYDQSKSWRSNSTEPLASEIERLLKTRYPSSDHPGYAIEHHGRLLADMLKSFPFSSHEGIRYRWLKNNLPAILANLKVSSHCKNCNKRVSTPPDDKIHNMARYGHIGKLRNQILAYHHRLAVSTVQRLITSRS